MAKRTIQEVTRLSNQFRREAITAGQRSPFRQSLYIKARLRGLSQERALEISRNRTAKQ